MLVRGLLALTVVSQFLTIPCSASPSAPTAAVVQVAQATDLDIPEGGLTLQVPAGWKSSMSDGQYVVSSGDDKAVIIFAPSDRKPAELLEAFKSSQTKKFTDIVSDGPAKEDTVAGMPVLSESGKAKSDGTGVIWSIDVISAKTSVVAYTLLEQAGLDKYKNDYKALLSSIKAK